MRYGSMFAAMLLAASREGSAPVTAHRDRHFVLRPSAMFANCAVTLSNRVGDKIQVTATLTTVDPNENGEGEPLLISTTGGEFSTVQSAYVVPGSYTYTAVQANETISGTIVGFDNDESCAISASSSGSLLSPGQKSFFGGLAAGLALPAGGFWVLAEACTASVIAGPLCGLPSGLIAAGFATGAALSGLIALDPSDPNYTQLVAVVVPTVPLMGPTAGVPPSVVNAVNALLATQAQLAGVEKALYTTLNRASGALDAGDNFWYGQQAAYAQSLASQATVIVTTEKGNLAGLQSTLRAAGIDATLPPSRVLTFESRMSSTGFSASELASLQTFGADPSVVAFARSLMIVQDINVVGGTVTHLLDPNLLPNGTLSDLTAAVSITRSGLVYNRATRTFSGTVTVVNTSGGTVTGPLTLVIVGLGEGTALANQSGLFQSQPYIQSNVQTLGPNQSFTLPLIFTNLTGARLSYDVQLFSGVF